MKEIYLLGVGHATSIFIELAEDCGYTVKGLFHYNSERVGEIDHGYSILGSFEDMFKAGVEGKNYCLTMGNMSIKEQVSKRILCEGGRIPTLVHPTVAVSRFAKISDCGVLVGRGCEIQPDVIVEEGCVLRTGCIVGHNAELQPYTFCGPASLIGAFAKIGSKAFIGQRSLIISGKVNHIGECAVVGAGAVVTKSVDAYMIVVGNPAVIIRKVNSRGVNPKALFFGYAALSYKGKMVA